MATRRNTGGKGNHVKLRFPLDQRGQKALNGVTNLIVIKPTQHRKINLRLETDKNGGVIWCVNSKDGLSINHKRME